MNFLSALRRAPERLLHAHRRSKAIARIRHRDDPALVLVVCHGNICRSPFAEKFLQQVLGPRGIQVASAGFIGPGRPAPSEAIDAAGARGVDLSHHRSRLLTPDVVAAADIVIVMDIGQAGEIRRRFGRSRRDIVLLGDLDPEPILTRHVRDPVYQPISVFTDVYARIERCCRALADALPG